MVVILIFLYILIVKYLKLFCKIDTKDTSCVFSLSNLSDSQLKHQLFTHSFYLLQMNIVGGTGLEFW